MILLGMQYYAMLGAFTQARWNAGRAGVGGVGRVAGVCWKGAPPVRGGWIPGVVHQLLSRLAATLCWNVGG